MVKPTLSVWLCVLTDIKDIRIEAVWSGHRRPVTHHRAAAVAVQRRWAWRFRRHLFHTSRRHFRLLGHLHVNRPVSDVLLKLFCCVRDTAAATLSPRTQASGSSVGSFQRHGDDHHLSAKVRQQLSRGRSQAIAIKSYDNVRKKSCQENCSLTLHLCSVA